jgi:hypothetical protein
MQHEVADDFDDMMADFRAAGFAIAPLSPVAPMVANDAAANAARAQVANFFAIVRAGVQTSCGGYSSRGS